MPTDDFEISADRVDLWVVPVPALPFDAVLPQVARRLSADEIEAAHRFVAERHRVLHAVSHAALRSLIAGYLGSGELDLEIERGEHGRPELRGRPLRFNLSHTDGIAIVGIAATADVGVDVERADKSRPVDRLARAVFTPAELDAFDGTPETFFTRWTLKEAYAKARGAGLTLGFRSFGFDLLDPPVLECPGEFDDRAAWRFTSWEPSPGRRAAAAVRSAGITRWRIRTVDTAAFLNGRPIFGE
ncbi:MAG: 4'-phosphopantetheinyl transferase superfamily protein [Thermoanaerobaculia bacterium]